MAAAILASAATQPAEEQTGATMAPLISRYSDGLGRRKTSEHFHLMFRAQGRFECSRHRAIVALAIRDGGSALGFAREHGQFGDAASMPVTVANTSSNSSAVASGICRMTLPVSTARHFLPVQHSRSLIARSMPLARDALGQNGGDEFDQPPRSMVLIASLNERRAPRH